MQMDQNKISQEQIRKRKNNIVITGLTIDTKVPDSLNRAVVNMMENEINVQSEIKNVQKIHVVEFTKINVKEKLWETNTNRKTSKNERRHYKNGTGKSKSDHKESRRK